MDNSKSQSFASGYFSYLQIIKITRMSPEIYLFVPSCIMGVLGSLSFFSGRHKFARETVSEVFPETVPKCNWTQHRPSLPCGPKMVNILSSQTWKNAPARLVVVTGFCRSVARHVAWQHKHRSVELIALFFNTVSNVLKKRERKKTQWPVTWPPYNSEGCEGSTLKLASSRKRDLCVARKLVNLSCSFRYSDLEGMLTSLSVSQPLFLLFRLKDFFDTRLWIMKLLVFLVLFYAKTCSIEPTVYIVGHSD